MKRETWVCWTVLATRQISEHLGNGHCQPAICEEDTEHFRGSKTAARKFYKQNYKKITGLHIGKLILEWVDGKWVDR
jgi:hypothetical protein